MQAAGVEGDFEAKHHWDGRRLALGGAETFQNELALPRVGNRAPGHAEERGGEE